MVKALGTIIDRCPKGRLYKKGKAKPWEK